MKKSQLELVSELCNVRGREEEIENNPPLQVKVSGTCVSFFVFSVANCFMATVQ